MKSFNKQIQITVELDTIANMLLETINPDAKHRDNIVEAIIGRLDANDDTKGMTLLYNALNGFNNTINFQSGDIVSCEETVYAPWDGNESTRRAIGTCKVVVVDPFRDNSLGISYMHPNSDGGAKERTLWVHHSKCAMVQSFDDVIL